MREITDSTHLEATRRPSQVRIRKSIVGDSQRSKQVTWCPTEAAVKEFGNPYESIDKEIIWYSRDELRSIRLSNEYTLAAFMKDHDDCNELHWRKNGCMENEHETMRGLEPLTDQGSWERFQHYRDCINKVLDEQDSQRGIDKKEAQSAYSIVKRISFFHVPFDHDRLGALCRDVTARAKRVALWRGRRDCLEVSKEGSHIILSQEEKIPAPNNDTVQTEASTDFSSNDNIQVSSLSESSAPTQEQEAQPLPANVSTAATPTPQTLQEKHTARYAAYLANRQQRVETREKADFEWEQRRLARKAEIHRPVNEHVAQMKRIINLTEDLIDLVQTERRVQ